MCCIIFDWVLDMVYENIKSNVMPGWRFFSKKHVYCFWQLARAVEILEQSDPLV